MFFTFVSPLATSMALKVQAVLTAWKDFNLHNTQQQIDETATQVTAKQDESDVSKKKLVELSKEFKKNTTEDTRKQVAPLLKSFQTEIDNLNKRCKFAETAFLNAYKNIIEIVDPLPSLEYCIGIEKKLGKNTDLEIENKNLRETLREYNEEFKEIRNQDVTIKNLKEKLKSYEDKENDNVSAKAKELESELMTQYIEKEKLLQETQNSALRRLQEAEARSKTLQHTLEQTQSELFDYKNKAEEFASAHSEETNILSIDLERANQRALLAEKEVARLEEQLAQAIEENSLASPSSATMNSNIEMLARSSLEMEVTAKSQEISQLVDDVKKLQNTILLLRDDTDKKIHILETNLDEKTLLTEELHTKLVEQNDYQEIKRELTIIKSVEFGADTREESFNQEDEHLGKPLELLLMEKNKSLQNENTVLKKANLDLTKHVSESNHEVSTLRSVTSEQKHLILQLESDLASMQSFSSLYRGEGEGCPSMPEMVAEAVKGSTADGDLLQSIIVDQRDDIDGRDSAASLLRSSSVTSSPLPGADTVSAAESLLPIITAQRERFKAKNDELEAELTLKKQQVSLIQNEVDSLRSDNVKLYEKIRFLQSYRGHHSADSSNTESRYSGQYEESLDPFASFSRTEKLRRYSALSPFEKITLSLGRFILGNKTARTTAIIYTGVVHCLVFLVLYILAHTESCKREMSSDCAQKFEAHMHDVHGDADFIG